MTTAVLTPGTAAKATHVGARLFRKPVLPRGKSIDYTDAKTGKTRKLDFTDEMLGGIVDSFDKGAYDTVKFQLADATNEHTLDAERARGTVRGFELTNGTLDMIIEATPEGAKVITDNPDLPVSARIVEDLTRADGQHFPYAIHHVLGTLDPRVTGLGGWEAVDLANDPDVPTVDLTAESYQPITKGTKMSDEKKPSAWAKLREKLGVGEDTTEEDLAAAVEAKLDENGDELSPEDLAALEALANDDKPVEASLTAQAQQQIDLANARAEQALTAAAELRTNAAKSAWTAERTERLHKGTPAALLDLAAPWCGGDAPSGFIDLANTATSPESVRDAAAADIRKMLDTFEGLVDLSVLGEAPEPDEAAAEARKEAIKRHRQAAGI